MSRYSDAIVADTPAGYWKLSETASTFADSSGNGNSGTWTGDATGTRGVFGGLAPDQQDGAIKCNGDGAGGAQGNYCAVPSGAGARPAAVNFTGKFTLEAWVYPISRPSAGNVSCIIESYVGGGLNGYALRMDENGFLQAYTIDGTGPAAVTQGVTALTVKRWAHVACVYDQTNLTTYINGVLDKQTANTTNPASGTGPLRIGARGDDAAAIFTGHIDDAAVYAVVTASFVLVETACAIGSWPSDWPEPRSSGCEKIVFDASKEPRYCASCASCCRRFDSPR